MSENTSIEWADHTFNPWEGCQKVGPGCDNCYAEARNARFGGGTAANWGPDAPRRRTSASNWRKPVKWNDNADAFFAEHGRRQRVFCASLADVFDNAVDPQWRIDLWTLIETTPNLDWLLLTKRIGVVPSWVALWPVPPNVWLGITVVNQEEASRDIPKLLAIPARVRFLSIEPMLGPIYLLGLNADQRPVLADIDWVIAGGESGPKARPAHPEWFRSLRDQCGAAGVPFMFKQWGEWLPVEIDCCADGDAFGIADDGTGRELSGSRYVAIRTMRDHQQLAKVGKKAAGRVLDGVQHDGVPS